jgi:hypothetical protein
LQMPRGLRKSKKYFQNNISWRSSSR